ncbi:hypothetical protein PsYK624_040500 [Phanerochaete sordida]|uniref:Uncharacterized protein n=1 Tax=Phanerochaete sordida TaxID=48140 RepID=A0A9P3G2R2_9APHY|nr:hypothetical protein PsYK624_040500 [Phanerochaete sordida]
MATTLQLPSFPRHGILLNPSPSTSPYSHTTSLPGTPNLISSLSSLSSSASSSSPHNLSEQDNYFLTYAAVKDPYSAIARAGSSQQNQQGGAAAVSRNNSAKKPSSAPQTRKIRFAPLPEPRRDELPDVFLDDSVENLNNFPVQRDALETPKRNSSRPSSLLFSGDHQTPSDSTPTTSNPNLQLGASAKLSVAPINIASSSTSGSDKDDSDWDITTPVSPNTALSSSSVERLPQSCPESPLNRRLELPKEKKSLTKKLLKPLFGRGNISTEDVLTLGVNQLFRSSTRDSDDGMSSGSATPARNRSKERASSASDGECGFGAPLCRSTSDNAPQKRKSRTSFLGFSHGNGSSSDGSLWRTQSGPGDVGRVKSREAEEAKRPRSGSTNQAYGPRKQLKMLNGRVYGAKRQSNLAKKDLFANARSDDNEFVEWGYGGMGSVKTAASVGADNKWARVQGNSALGVGNTEAGWSKTRRPTVDEEDDGSGMAWLKKRKEQREREKQEAEARAAKEAAEKENHDTQQPDSEVSDPDPPVVAKEVEAVEEAKEVVAVKEEAGHVTTAIALPAHHRPTHHHSRSMERVPSAASHVLKATPERRDSQDTARAVSPPAVVDAEEVVGEMEVDADTERVGSVRGRRESASSTSGTSSFGSDDEDADVEDSPKDSYGEDDDEDSEDDEVSRRTCLGAGVEKISRHKEKSAVHPQDGHGAT